MIRRSFISCFLILPWLPTGTDLIDADSVTSSHCWFDHLTLLSETWNHLYFESILIAQTQQLIHPESPLVADTSAQARMLAHRDFRNHPQCSTLHVMGERMAQYELMVSFWGWEFEVGLCGKLFVVPSVSFWESWKQTHSSYDGRMERHHTCSAHTHTHTPALCLSPVLSTLCSFQSNQGLEETEESTDTMGAALIKSIISHLASRVCW